MSSWYWAELKMFWVEVELIRAHWAEMEVNSARIKVQGRLIEFVQASSMRPTKVSPQTWSTKAETASLNCLARDRVIGPWGSSKGSLLELGWTWGVAVSLNY